LPTLWQTNTRCYGSINKKVLQEVQTNSRSKENKDMAQRKLPEIKMSNKFRPKYLGKIKGSNGEVDAIKLWDQFDEEEEQREEE